MVNKEGPVLDIPTRTSKQIGINENGPVLELQPLTSDDKRRLTGEAILHVVTLPILGVAVWAGLTGARLQEGDANVAIATSVGKGPGTVITVRDPKDPHTVVCIGRGVTEQDIDTGETIRKSITTNPNTTCIQFKTGASGNFSSGVLLRTPFSGVFVQNDVQQYSNLNSISRAQ
jgi:hypothetical protein